MIHYNAKFLRNLELEITMAYSFDKDYPQCKRLIELRRDILNEQALANQAELLPNIIAFNDALFDHTYFALTDFIFFREFVEEINVKIEESYSY